jgi:O-antigen ligase
MTEMATSAAPKPDLDSPHMRLRSPAARDRWAQLSDGLAAAVAVSLPWSTSATGILLGLWLISLIPLLDFEQVRREVMSPAGGLPVALWAMGAIGMLWADVSWSERIGGLSGFHKLLVIPLLLARFRRTGRADWVLLGLLGSCVALMALSWGLALTPGLTLRGKTDVGVPVKDYVLQSELFAICAFGLIGQAVEVWRSRARLALVVVALAAGFVGNILYVQTARTTLVAMAVLVVVFAFRKFGWIGALGVVAIAAVLACGAWMSSPYLRDRVAPAIRGVQLHDPGDAGTTVGLRLGYWRASLKFISEAPALGHGTGSIPQLFRRAATAETNPMTITTNPHNQILVIALDLGLLGTIVLLAMWVAHLALFRGSSLLAWFGLVIVVQNIVACLFNSHLFDFSQGWLYVMGVGALGGSVLHQKTLH